MNILIASPVRQDRDILQEFLFSLKHLIRGSHRCDFFFIDDCDPEASKILNRFQVENSVTTIENSSSITGSESYYNDHNWNNHLINRIAESKNVMLEYAISHAYDYIFLIDSDIILHPQTLLRLISVQKDIVSNIFWTKTSPWSDFEPQVWLMDQGAFWDDRDNKTVSKTYRAAKKEALFRTLKQPGTYKVGGLGACTLINSKVLKAGVNFKEIYNISFWGEDRAFCIRAAVAGFELFVDTVFPAYHIYRKSYLKGVPSFKQNGYTFTSYEDNLTLNARVKYLIERLKIKLRLFLYSRNIY